MTTISLVLVLLGLVCGFLGFVATAVSGCCGSRDGSDGTYALVGLAIAGALAVAAAGLWSPFLPAWLILVCTASVPVLCLVATGSSDLNAVWPVAVVGWLLLAWYLRRPAASGWLARRSQ